MNKFSTIMLIPGCAVGAGLFSFPVITGLSGFFPSTIAIVLTAIFSTFAGLAIVELSSFLREKHLKNNIHLNPEDREKIEQEHQNMHFFSINQHFLPKSLQAIALILFLFMGYGSLVGYVAGMVPIVNSFLPNLLHFSTEATTHIISLFILCIFFYITHQKHKLIIYLNNIFTPLVIVVYAYLLGMAFFHFDPSMLTKHADYSKMYLNFPILLTAFSHQLMIPTIVNMMKGNKKQLRQIVLAGNAINLIVYLIWNTVILGCVSLHDIEHAFRMSHPITMVLLGGQGNLFTISSNIFALITMFTSFLAISLSVKDYWADHLKINSDGLWSQIFLFIPVIVIFFMFDKLFLWVFSSTGGYGDSILFGLLPIYMLYNAYKQGFKEYYSKGTLLFASLFFLGVFGIQVYSDVKGLFI